jgi:hypothetical protein
LAVIFRIFRKKARQEALCSGRKMVPAPPGGGESTRQPKCTPEHMLGQTERNSAQAQRRIGEIVSSHMIKYPYSFYALAKDVTDEALKKRILAKVSRLLKNAEGGVEYTKPLEFSP